jgi:hypothetical protein
VWRQVVERDLRARIGQEIYEATWLVSARATLADGRLAVKATCLFPVKLAGVPLEAPRPVWCIIVTAAGDHGFYSLPNTESTVSTLKEDNVEFVGRLRAAMAAIGTTDDADARKTLGRDFFAWALWREDTGFSDRDKADATWAAVTGGIEVEVIDGEADPVPIAITRQQIVELIAKSRATVETRVADGMIDASELVDFDKRIEKARRFPPQLVALVVDLTGLPVPDVLILDEKAATAPAPGRAASDEKPVDDIECQAPAEPVPAPPSSTLRPDDIVRDEYTATATPNLDSRPDVLDRDDIAPPRADAMLNGSDDIAGDAIATPTSDTSSMAPVPPGPGRRRLHPDDAARKRVWAANRRSAERAARAERGETRKPAGRPRIHADQAARQRAYEDRKKGRDAPHETGGDHDQ